MLPITVAFVVLLVLAGLGAKWPTIQMHFDAGRADQRGVHMEPYLPKVELVDDDIPSTIKFPTLAQHDNIPLKKAA